MKLLHTQKGSSNVSYTISFEEHERETLCRSIVLEETFELDKCLIKPRVGQCKWSEDNTVTITQSTGLLEFLPPVIEKRFGRTKGVPAPVVPRNR